MTTYRPAAAAGNGGSANYMTQQTARGPCSPAPLPALEYPSVRVPYECLVRSFRGLQKQLEKELAAVAAFCQGPKCSEGSRQDCALRMEKLAAKLQQLKAKIAEAGAEAEELTDRCRGRLRAAEEAPNVAALQARADFDVDCVVRQVDRALYEFATRRGLVKTAEALRCLGELGGLVDLEAHRSARDAIDALGRRDLRPALEWCAANRSRLKKACSGVEGSLQLQQLLALLAEGRPHDALAYVRANVAPQDIESVPEFRQALALLAFPDLRAPPGDRYRALMSEARWQALAEELDRAFAAVLGLYPRPVLELLLQAGCLALKSPQCLAEHNAASMQGGGEGGHPTCPTCDPAWTEYVRGVPAPNHAQSCLVCPLTGDVMDDANPPMASPDGHVYSQTALKELAGRASDGLIECPRTKQHFRLEQFQKVFQA